MAQTNNYQEEPCFVISIAARMVGVHAQTLRYYERVGLIWPSRTVGRQRLYSPSDIERLRRIKTFTEEMGMNLAGAEVALKLVERIDQLEHEVEMLSQDVSRLHSQLRGSLDSPESPGSFSRQGAYDGLEE